MGSELVEWAKRASVYIYAATNGPTADDISPKLCEIAATLSAQEDELGRLREALAECAAEWRSPPTTLGGAMEHVSIEFRRRMQIAADALEGSKR